MSYVIIYSNTVSSTNYPVPVSVDEQLQIAAGVQVVGIGYTAVNLQSGGANSGKIDVEGDIAGATGVAIYYASGSEDVSIGSSGSVTGSNYGVTLSSASDDSTQILQNAGYIHGDTTGVELDGGSTQIENSGTVSGSTGLYMSANGSIVDNDASGLLTGQNYGVSLQGYGAQVYNAGRISAASSPGSAMYLANFDDSVESSGEIQGVNKVVYFNESEGRIQNSGTISAAGDEAIFTTGNGYDIENSGIISADSDTIDIAGQGGGTDWIVNETGGVVEAQNNEFVIYDLRDAAHIINYGDLFGALFAGGDDSAFTNTGNYTGQALLYGGGVLVRNAGKMSYDGYATLPAVAAATPDVVSAALISGQNILINGAAGLDDRLVNATGAVISASGGTAIYHGLAGTFRLVNRGDIYGDLNLNGQTTVVNANTVGGDVDFNAGAALFANRDLVDGSVYFSGTGNIYRGALGAVTGTIYGAGADGKYNGGAGDDSFDFTASGAKYAYGGDGDDTFTFKASGLNPKTTVIGGAGDDTLTFTTAGLISAISFAHVSSIETINLAPSGTSNITLSDALVTSAAGGGLTVNGGSAGDTINAANVVTAGDVVTIYGANGADSITAGAAKDVFVYKAALESTGPTYDTVAGANFALDRFDVSAAAGAILAINAAASGTLSAATFNTDLASDLPAAKLGAHDALLFTANGGGLSGQTFLVVDVNGTAGYQANSDLVIRLTSTTGTLSTGDFV